MSKKAIWTGRIVSGLTGAFLAFDAIAHIAQPADVVKATEQIGFPVGALAPLGVIQLVCLALYLLPRTAVLGAVLWTGYLGGAVATLVHVGAPASQLAFPLLTAVAMWGSLALRDNRVRSLVKSMTLSPA
jgi:hypothetical protein